MSDPTHTTAAGATALHDDAAATPAHEPDTGGHGHDGHEEGPGHGPALGPIDWAAWGAGVLGVGAGLAVAACLYLATAA